jgi:hypothetical protein
MDPRQLAVTAAAGGVGLHAGKGAHQRRLQQQAPAAPSREQHSRCATLAGAASRSADNGMRAAF